MPRSNSAALVQVASFGARVLLDMFLNVELTWRQLEGHAKDTGCLVEVRATEPCGPACICARYVAMPADCLTHPEAIADAIHRLTLRARPMAGGNDG